MVLHDLHLAGGKTCTVGCDHEGDGCGKGKDQQGVNPYEKHQQRGHKWKHASPKNQEPKLHKVNPKFQDQSKSGQKGERLQ